jgi:transposase-like protein
VELVGEGRRGGQRDSVAHGKPTGARSASSTNPQPGALPKLVDLGATTENELARYGQAFKDRAVARLLPPQSASADAVAREVGVSADTLERWRAQALARPTAQRVWTAAARLEAVIATAALDETARSAWCREHGVYAQQLQQWRASATQALAQPEEARASPQQTRNDRRRIKQLERELRRKDRALAETAALLVLSKKVEAIFHKGEDE